MAIATVTPAGPLSRNGTVRRTLPSAFCWTKYGTEAGQDFHEILARKERERVSNGGLFLWGIGNSLRPSLAQLVSTSIAPLVCFSPMKSAPATQDVNPGDVSVWDSGLGLDGVPFQLPHHSVVTSRSNAQTGRKKAHFALVCKADASILSTRETYEDVALSHVRNLRSGAIVGSSQVTSVVRHERDTETRTGLYPVTFAATLVPPYFVTLTAGVSIGDHESDQFSADGGSFESLLAIRRAHFGHARPSSHVALF
jgi:hypothetical protein